MQDVGEWKNQEKSIQVQAEPVHFIVPARPIFFSNIGLILFQAMLGTANCCESGNNPEGVTGL